MNDFSKFKKIDAHTHIGAFGSPFNIDFNIERLLEQMAEYNIEKTILCASSAYTNDETLAAYKAHPDKIEPLQRALKGLKVWICGLRREQSITRKDMQLVEWDANNGLIKLNPLINWTEDEVKLYVKEHHIPYNKLHDRGFPSIGCQPCTRAVEPGEDIRSGRWWWENPEHRECGLHRR